MVSHGGFLHYFTEDWQDSTLYTGMLFFLDSSTYSPHTSMTLIRIVRVKLRHIVWGPRDTIPIRCMLYFSLPLFLHLSA